MKGRKASIVVAMLLIIAGVCRLLGGMFLAITDYTNTKGDK